MKSIGTYRTISENLSNRKRAWLVVNALSKLQGYSNGTVDCPCEEASAMYHGYLSNGAENISLIEKVIRDGTCSHYTGDIVVDMTDSTLFVGWSTRAVTEYGITEVWIGDLSNQECE